MAERWQRTRDAFHAGLDGLRDLAEDLLGEVALGLGACTLLILGWWAYRSAPYPTMSIGAGLLLFAGYGVLAFLRGLRGRRLAGGLTIAAVLTAGVTLVLLAYLPGCGCLD